MAQPLRFRLSWARISVLKSAEGGGDSEVQPALNCMELVAILAGVFGGVLLVNRDGCSGWKGEPEAYTSGPAGGVWGAVLSPACSCWQGVGGGIGVYMLQVFKCQAEGVGLIWKAIKSQ